MIKQSTMHSL